MTSNISIEYQHIHIKEVCKVKNNNMLTTKYIKATRCIKLFTNS